METQIQAKYNIQTIQDGKQVADKGKTAAWYGNLRADTFKAGTHSTKSSDPYWSANFSLSIVLL